MFEICHCHYCSDDAHAQNICSILDYEVDLCCWSSGAVSGAAVCTPVLYTGLYSCLVSSLGADPFTVLFSHVVES